MNVDELGNGYDQRATESAWQEVRALKEKVTQLQMALDAERKYHTASDVGGCILCTSGIPARISHNDHSCGCTVEDGPCGRHKRIFETLNHG